METNIELYDIQRTRQCEDTLTTSDPYIQGRLQLPRQSSMERSDQRRTTNRRDQPRTIWWMPRQRLHVSHVSRRIETVYFNIYSCILCKLWQWRYLVLRSNTNFSCNFIRKEIWSTQEDYICPCSNIWRSRVQIETNIEHIEYILSTL